MAKLYIFGIGGTGARVLRSLTMMLASGVQLGQDEIVPIFIDPDESNADLSRTVDLMNLYSRIRQDLTFASSNNNKFFRTSINQELPGFRLQIKDTASPSSFMPNSLFTVVGYEFLLKSTIAVAAKNSIK